MTAHCLCHVVRIVAGVTWAYSRDAWRWSLAMKHAANVLDHGDDLRDQHRDKFLEWWENYTVANGSRVPLPADWEDSIDQFGRQGARGRDVKESIRIAMTKKGLNLDDRWRYFCGVLWRKIGEQRDVAVQIIDTTADIEAEGDA